MLKIETNINDDMFSIDYQPENTNTIEHFMLIAKIVDIILENREDVKEKDIIKFIKNRQKFFEVLEESDGEE